MNKPLLIKPKAKTVIQRENLQFLKGKLHLNKGNIALTSNQIDSAIDHYTQAINAPSDQQDLYLSADINTQKAKALVKAKRFDEAKVQKSLILMIVLTRYQRPNLHHN